MGFVSEYFEVAKNVITSPTEFFESENRRDGFGYPLKFAAFSLLISGLFSAAQTAISGTGAEVNLSIPILAGVSAVATPILGVIGLTISAGLIHIFVALFGGENGYSNTLSILGYTTAIGVVGSANSVIMSLATVAGGIAGTLLSIVGGLVALVVGLYGIYIQSKGISEFQDLSFGKSVLSIILPGIIIGVLVFGLVIVVLGASLATMAA
ncbi:MAG: uncharacterized Yip1 domain protein [Candidatus Nanosalina sp. J07AB43]|nr:MAG: uncharacterized Yip1 domain protein [Candidatus Nanosalina sp. J07AB43]